MGLFSKLKALLGAKENQITPEENDSSKETSDELDESMLVDDYGNFHRHDFSSKEEFENDGFSHVEYFTRRDQLTYILQHCRYTWSDEVMKKCHIYFLLLLSGKSYNKTQYAEYAPISTENGAFAFCGPPRQDLAGAGRVANGPR